MTPHRLSIPVLLVTVLAALSAASSRAQSQTSAPLLAALSAPSSPDTYARVRGMTISCPTWGGEWGSDAMVQTMRTLKGLGVNWICIHPYAGIQGDGTVTVSRRAYDRPEWITRPIREAHKLGLKIMIKPHLAYWGSPFSWRGEIAFDEEEQWERFFRTYRAWVVELAGIAKDADAFVVGTELDRTVQRQAEWREIIAAGRAETSMPLTYSANWDSYDRVPFWDELDVIGIQSYFPLVDHEGLPEPQELDEGWVRLLSHLKQYAAERERRVVFGELGYNRSSEAAVRPWEHRSGGPEAEEIQRRCLAAALRALEHDDTVVGAFLWKWFPGEVERGNFLQSTPAMREVIARFWGPYAGAAVESR